MYSLSNRPSHPPWPWRGPWVRPSAQRDSQSLTIATSGRTVVPTTASSFRRRAPCAATSWKTRVRSEPSWSTTAPCIFSKAPRLFRHWKYMVASAPWPTARSISWRCWPGRFSRGVGCQLVLDGVDSMSRNGSPPFMVR